MFLLIDKPKGISSFKTINAYAKEHEIKKLGHTGTLDPLATGLLLIATDDDTKLIDYIDKGNKTYIATMQLGKCSNTYDIEGDVTLVTNNLPSKERIKDCLKEFVGIQKQVPPQFSAKKVNGQTAYKLAREGKTIELKNIEVNIEKIDIISIEKDIVVFETTVSRGTYIRSIINDFGNKIGCGAIMTELRRTAIGSLNESDLGEVNIEPLLTLPIVQMHKNQIAKLIKGISIENNTKREGKFIIAVSNVICGIANFNTHIKSIKLFGNKIDTI